MDKDPLYLVVPLVAVGCTLAYGFAQMAAKTHPLDWGTVFAAALMEALAFYIVYMSAPAGDATIAAVAAWFVALLLGANRGTVALEKRHRDDRARDDRALAYVASLGPCSTCGSGDLDRRPCDTCHAVLCLACSLKHRRGYDAPCPAATARLSPQ